MSYLRIILSLFISSVAVTALNRRRKEARLLSFSHGFAFVSISILALGFSQPTRAVTISFVGACSESPVAIDSVNFSEVISVGAATIEVLDRLDVDYLGTARGINSIFGTPTGLDAMEILSDQDMRAYGWCYSVNGVSPEELSDASFVRSDTDDIVWYYAFATMEHGEWINQCSPAYIQPPTGMCLREFD